MTTGKKDHGSRPGASPSRTDIDAPRLTPQGRTGPAGKGEDSTDPMGKGAKKGQGDKAEG